LACGFADCEVSAMTKTKSLQHGGTEEAEDLKF